MFQPFDLDTEIFAPPASRKPFHKDTGEGENVPEHVPGPRRPSEHAPEITARGRAGAG